ncbi:MAG: reverse transcriptase domain-containing protein, partial [Bacteroidales bacterium]
NMKGSYILLGAGFLIRNKEWTLKTIQSQLGITAETSINTRGSLRKTLTISEYNNTSLEDMAKCIKDEFQSIFSEDLENVEACKIVKHAIVTTEKYPLAQKNCQIPIHWEAEIEQEMTKWKKNGIIQESNSAWASRLIPIKKKDGSLRLCVDYRNLNRETVRDQYPLPRIDTILDSLAEGTIFSTLDATAGYHQLEIDPKDRPKTAFRYKNGLYEFIRMPFGLSNAPATFQRAMDIVLKDYNWKCCIPYLDDIIIYSPTIEKHQEDIKNILIALDKAGIKLNRNKCKLFRKEVKILGSIVSKGLVKPDPEKTMAIRQARKPADIRELRGFLGLINYCREFIPNLATEASSIYNLLKGEDKRSKRKIEWTKDLTENFNKVRNLISDQTARSQPNIKKPFILTTDASDTGIGAILTQKDDDGHEKMIYAYSKLLDSPQKNYSVTDKELLAVVKSIEHFRRFLVGKRFILRTDHKALEYMSTCKNPTARLLRWALKLQEYDFEIQYIRGPTNKADYLSRLITRVKLNVGNVQLAKEKQKLEELHMLLGHGSTNNMIYFWGNRYKWPNFYKEVETLVKECEVCAKAGDKIDQPKLKSIETNAPNQIWQLDLIGRILDVKGKGLFIFTAQDLHTKWVEAMILRDKSGKSIMEAINKTIITKHGKPETIYTDNGKEFVNKELTKFCLEKKIEQKVSAAYYHKSVGGIERANRSLLKKLRCLTECGRIDWKNKVQQAVNAVNYSFNRSIGMSPFVMKQGKLPLLPSETKEGEGETCVNIEERNDIRKSTRKKYRKEISSKYKKRCKEQRLGSKVWIYNGPQSSPMKPRWKNGYTVIKRRVDGSYVLNKAGRTYIRAPSHVKDDVTKSK